jgi:hypothetical protein
MKLFLKSTILLFSAMLFFTACNEDNIDTINVDDVNYEPDESYKNSLLSGLTAGNSEYAKLGCVEIDYPFSLKVENDEKTTVQNYQELQTALDASSDDQVLDLEFPVQGRDHNGVETTFADGKSLGTSYISCVPGSGWTKAEARGAVIPVFLFDDYCLDLKYPVSLEDENGNGYIAEDVIDIISYRLQNDELYYTLPLQVKEEGRSVSINDMDEMFDLFTSCEDSRYNPLPMPNDSLHVAPFDCFSFVFPLDVRIVVPDTVATIDSEDDLIQLYLSGVEYELIYPFDVVTESGLTVTINAPIDFIDVLIDCSIIVIDTTDNSCEQTDAYVALFYNALNIFTTNNYPYDINYPTTLIVEGTSVTLNSDDDFIPAIGGNPSRFVDAEIVYPVSVTQFGRTITLNNDDEVCDFSKTLTEPCENKPAHIQYFHNTAGVPIDCAFFVDYPLEIINTAGNTVTIANRDDYLAELDVPGAYDAIELVYPVTGTEVQGGQTITFANGDDICNFINQCD